MMKTWWIVSSVDEEDSGAGQGGQGVGHLADSGVVDESSKEEQKAWRAQKKKGDSEIQLNVPQGTTWQKPTDKTAFTSKAAQGESTN